MFSRLIPNRHQWKNWSLPSKASYYSAVIGTISLFVALVAMDPNAMRDESKALTNDQRTLESQPQDHTPRDETKADDLIIKARDDRITEINLLSDDGDEYTGNVTHNDQFGYKGPGLPKLVFQKDEDRARGSQTFSFDHGSITLMDDGRYRLMLDRTVSYNHNYELNYTIQDATGQLSSAVLRFTITGDTDE